MSNFRNSKASFKTNGRTLALGMGSGFSARTRAIVATTPIDPANNSLFIFGSSNLTYQQAKLIARAFEIGQLTCSGTSSYVRGDTPPCQQFATSRSCPLQNCHAIGPFRIAGRKFGITYPELASNLP